MKKRFICLGLCLAMILGSCGLVFAGGSSFSDISDLKTARNAEVLRMMGVVEGVGGGLFKPNSSLTRAQFCKMAVCITGNENEASKYSNVTIFPDVKPSHWASSFINLSARGMKIIAGFDNGLFKPDQAITSGQAVTILMRVLGYSDKVIGGVWPDSYMKAAESEGLLEGCGFKTGRETISRAQAAQLFVNMLTTELHDGGKLYDLSKEVVFKSISTDTNKMNCSGDDNYVMVNRIEDSMFIGMTGKVVLDAKGRALAFLPSQESIGLGDGIVIANEDGSTLGFKELAGGTNYTIYRDGVKSSASEIKKYDVASYNPATGAIRICSDRISAYYEDCTGNAKSPETITILGGKTFDVMESAKPSVANFKPGDQMIVLFTADGKVAGALSTSTSGAAKALDAEVDKKGTVSFTLCGEKVELSIPAEKKYYSKPVTLRAVNQDSLKLQSLSNDDTKGTVVFARVSVVESGEGEAKNVEVTFDCGPDKSYNFGRGGDFRNGQRIAVKISESEQAFSWSLPLDKLSAVSNSSWLGKKAVTYGTSTYEINEDTVFYNLDTKSWSTMEKCLEYCDKADMYVYEGVVRIVEFSADIK